jgi:methionyl-tRNA formyltransferase
MAPLITPGMRIAFMGTPDFAVPTLETLIADPAIEVVAVYSQPSRPAGRGKAPRLSPVQARAEAAGIEVRTPLSLRDPEVQAAFAALELDVGIVAAYGLILPRPVLDSPRRGCLNVHASLLPRWRGAAPIQRAILAGDEQTGVTIMRMEQGLDTGPILAQWPVAVDRKTAGELGGDIARDGANLMLSVLRKLDQVGPRPQNDERATYAPKVDKSEAKLDFRGSATEAERQVRAFNPDPGAWFGYAGNRVKIHSAEMVEASGEPGTVLDDELTIACGEGALRPTSVQREGRAPMSPAELLRGFPIPVGARLE